MSETSVFLRPLLAEVSILTRKCALLLSKVAMSQEGMEGGGGWGEMRLRLMVVVPGAGPGDKMFQAGPRAKCYVLGLGD